MLPVSTLAALLFFAPVVLVYLASKAKSVFDRFRGAGEQNGEEGESAHLDGDKLLKASAELGLLAFLTWLCENRPIFEHDLKMHDVDFFIFVIAIAFLVAFLFSLHVEPKDQGIMNRDQTEEWRGFMQMIFLLYHYFALEEVYPLIRLFISCYVFLTGFGNTSFFYLRRDYSLARFLSMLWRLCFSCVVLAVVHNNPLILYYIVPLHTFYFLVAYATMSMFEKQVNYTRNGLRIKLVILGSILYVCWEFPAVFNVVFSFLSSEQHPGAAVGAYGTRYEWQFRSGLDHYSAFFGMIFASAFPMLETREALVVSQTPMLRGILACIFAFIFILWWVFLFPQNKYEFNPQHAYTFVFPLCAYLFLRNVTLHLRRVHLSMFAFAGKYTLETYLLQHHVWLTSNAKTVLVLIPGMPKLNFAIVSVIYFLLSMKLFNLTVDLRSLVIPSDNMKKAISNLMISGGLAGACFVLAQLLVLSGAAVAPVVLACIAGATFILVAWIKRNKSQVDPPSDSNGTSVSKVATIVFSVTFMVFGLICAAYPAEPPAGLVQCDVNSGNWVVPFNRQCGQSPQSMYAYCSSRAWTWNVMEQRACGWKHVSHMKGNFDKIILVGKENKYALALARIDNKKFVYSPKNPVTDFANGTIILREKGFKGISLTKKSIVVCQDVESLDACKGLTEATAISLVRESNIPDVVDVERLKEGAPADDLLEKDNYADDVYDVAAQLIVNLANRKLKAPGKATLDPPGGLASNPFYGAMFLAVAFFALFMNDGYLGIVALLSRIYGLEHKLVPEEVMDRIHEKVPGLAEDSSAVSTAVAAVPSSSAVPKEANADKDIEADDSEVDDKDDTDDTSKLMKH